MDRFFDWFGLNRCRSSTSTVPRISNFGIWNVNIHLTCALAVIEDCCISKWCKLGWMSMNFRISHLFRCYGVQRAGATLGQLKPCSCMLYLSPIQVGHATSRALRGILPHKMNSVKKNTIGKQGCSAVRGKEMVRRHWNLHTQKATWRKFSTSCFAGMGRPTL